MQESQTDFLTILRSVHRKAQSKTFHASPSPKRAPVPYNGTTIYTEGYAKEGDWTGAQVKVEDLDSLADVLLKLQERDTWCVVRGDLRDDVTSKTVFRRTYIANSDTPVPAIIPADHHWIMVDVDGGDWTPGTIRSALPPEFQNARCFWTASNSAGVKPGFRAHLWFWADRKVCDASLKAWLKSTECTAIDLTLFQPVQPHYTALPLFRDGIVPPTIEKGGWLEGAPFVTLPDCVVDLATYQEQEAEKKRLDDEARAKAKAKVVARAKYEPRLTKFVGTKSRQRAERLASWSLRQIEMAYEGGRHASMVRACTRAVQFHNAGYSDLLTESEIETAYQKALGSERRPGAVSNALRWARQTVTDSWEPETEFWESHAKTVEAAAPPSLVQVISDADCVELDEARDTVAGHLQRAVNSQLAMDARRPVKQAQKAHKDACASYTEDPTPENLEAKGHAWNVLQEARARLKGLSLGGSNGPRLAIQLPPGTGKTHATIEAVAQAVARTHVKQTIVIAAKNHALVAEYYEGLLNATLDEDAVYIVPVRTKKNCKGHEDYLKASRRAPGEGSAFCKACPFRGECTTHGTLGLRPGAINLVTSEWAIKGGIRPNDPNIDVVIFDENPNQTKTHEFDAERLKAIQRALVNDQNLYAIDQLAKVVERLEARAELFKKRKLKKCKPKFGRDATLEFCGVTQSDLWMMGQAFRPDMEGLVEDDDEIEWTHVEALKVWSIGKEVRCSVTGSGSLIIGAWIPLELPPRAAVVYLDATMSEASRNAVLGEVHEHVQVRVKAATGTTVVNVTGPAGLEWRKVGTAEETGDEDFTEEDQIELKPASKRRWESVLGFARALGRTETPLVYAQKQQAQRIGAQWYKGSSRGTNAYEGSGVAVLLPYHESSARSYVLDSDLIQEELVQTAGRLRQINHENQTVITWGIGDHEERDGDGCVISTPRALQVAQALPGSTLIEIPIHVLDYLYSGVMPYGGVEDCVNWFWRFVHAECHGMPASQAFLRGSQGSKVFAYKSTTIIAKTPEPCDPLVNTSDLPILPSPEAYDRQIEVQNSLGAAWLIALPSDWTPSPKQVLDAVIPHARAQGAKWIQVEGERYNLAPMDTLADVREAIKAGARSANAVASILAVHTTTLTRRLERAGTTIQEQVAIVESDNVVTPTFTRPPAWNATRDRLLSKHAIPFDVPTCDCTACRPYAGYRVVSVDAYSVTCATPKGGTYMLQREAVRFIHAIDYQLDDNGEVYSEPTRSQLLARATLEQMRRNRGG